jgi:DNA-binding response OmpR family regulator
VLVIDDDLATRQGMVEALREEGFDVVDADNGAQGLARAATFQPAVVVVDLVMPLLNGYTFVQAMRHRQPGVPVGKANTLAG